MVVIDDYSHFPVVEVLTSASSKAVIPKLDNIFSTFGIPTVARSDNGPPFNGHEFSQFADHLDSNTGKSARHVLKRIQMQKTS